MGDWWIDGFAGVHRSLLRQREYCLWEAEEVERSGVEWSGVVLLSVC